jgi:hypothetical protein
MIHRAVEASTSYFIVEDDINSASLMAFVILRFFLRAYGTLNIHHNFSLAFTGEDKV